MRKWYSGMTAVARAPRSCQQGRGSVSGDVLLIEHRDNAENQRIELTPGQVEWEDPTGRVHRAVNIGQKPYERITIFLLDRPDSVAQPNQE